jgi:hypothetical protein
MKEIVEWKDARGKIKQVCGEKKKKKKKKIREKN